MGIKGSSHGQLGAPNGIAIDRTGNIYAADASKHVVEKLAPDGTVMAEWKVLLPDFMGRAGSPLAQMIPSMSSIRAERES